MHDGRHRISRRDLVLQFLVAVAWQKFYELHRHVRLFRRDHFRRELRLLPAVKSLNRNLPFRDSLYGRLHFRVRTSAPVVRRPRNEWFGVEIRPVAVGVHLVRHHFEHAVSFRHQSELLRISQKYPFVRVDAPRLGRYLYLLRREGPEVIRIDGPQKRAVVQRGPFPQLFVFEDQILNFAAVGKGFPFPGNALVKESVFTGHFPGHALLVEIQRQPAGNALVVSKPGKSDMVPLPRFETDLASRRSRLLLGDGTDLQKPGLCLRERHPVIRSARQKDQMFLPIVGSEIRLEPKRDIAEFRRYLNILHRGIHTYRRQKRNAKQKSLHDHDSS